jgi:hypothetical protein
MIKTHAHDSIESKLNIDITTTAYSAAQEQQNQQQK